MRPLHVVPPELASTCVVRQFSSHQPQLQPLPGATLRRRSHQLFTAQCTLVHLRGLGSHVVCLSVCPSVTLVICDHIGWKFWKLIAQTISPTSSLFVAKRRSINLPSEEQGKFDGDYSSWVGNSVLEHRSGNISERRKDRGKVTM